MFSKCYNTISPQGTKEMMSDESGAMLIDVREAREHKSGHIKQSKNISVRHIYSMKSELPSDKQTPIIVYCLSGHRAKRACKMLSKLGYTNLHCLGAIYSWPYGVVN